MTVELNSPRKTRRCDIFILLVLSLFLAHSLCQVFINHQWTCKTSFIFFVFLFLQVSSFLAFLIHVSLLQSLSLSVFLSLSLSLSPPLFFSLFLSLICCFLLPLILLCFPASSFGTADFFFLWFDGEQGSDLNEQFCGVVRQVCQSYQSACDPVDALQAESGPKTC